jgi:hypothetical protein
MKRTPKTEAELFAERVEVANRTLSQPFSADLLELVKGSRRYEDERVAKFAERFATDPYDAFRWGQDAVEAAAYVQVYGHVERLAAERVLDALDAECERRETETYNSTSPMANNTEACLRVAYARVRKEVRQIFARRADAEKTVSEAKAASHIAAALV